MDLFLKKSEYGGTPTMEYTNKNIYDNNKIKITPNSRRDFTRGAMWLP
jgi:hypothetical protein